VLAALFQSPPQDGQNRLVTIPAQLRLHVDQGGQIEDPDLDARFQVEIGAPCSTPQTPPTTMKSTLPDARA